MPHIPSLPVGYMDILKEKIRSVISPCAVKKNESYFSCGRMVIKPATKMMTLKTMMTIP